MESYTTSLLYWQGLPFEVFSLWRLPYEVIYFYISLLNDKVDAQRMKRTFMRFVDNAGPGQPRPSLVVYRINGNCSTCQLIQNIEIRLHGCVHSSGPSLFAYGIRSFFPRCSSQEDVQDVPQSQNVA